MGTHYAGGRTTSREHKIILLSQAKKITCEICRLNYYLVIQRSLKIGELFEVACPSLPACFVMLQADESQLAAACRLRTLPGKTRKGCVHGQ